MRTSQGEIRTAVRHARSGRSDAERRAAGDALSSRLLALPEVARSSCIAAYASLPGEPDIWVAVRALHERHCTVLLPRVAGPRRLEWGAYEGDAALAPGAWGILEPTAPGGHALAEASVIVVPAVAVDPSNGARIGYGGGYFDTALASIPRRAQGGPLRVAPCFDDEVIDGLPINDWDARMDVIVTPQRTLTV